MWPDRIGDPADVAYACAWKAPHGLLAQFVNLRAIFSLGAGVDDLMGDPALPHIPVARIVDPDLTMRMTEYVVLHVLMIHRRQQLYDAQQRARVWRDHPQPAAHEVTVGVMGLGELGRDAAEVLTRLGFQVAGWSRTAKAMSGVQNFHGAEGLDAFLARTEILVCLLPHTPATEEVLNLTLLRKLKRDGALGGAYLINAGRGRLQVDADISGGAGRRLARGRDPRRVSDRAAAGGQFVMDASEGHAHAAQRRRSRSRALVTNVLEQIARLERGEPLRERDRSRCWLLDLYRHGRA